MNDCASISHIHNATARDPDRKRVDTSAFSADTAKAVRHFHRSIPGYEPTPLHSLNDLAAELGVSRIWIKDESHRFGLGAFKSLGASFALARALTRRFGLGAGESGAADMDALLALRGRIEEEAITVVTATDGNHGRGLAWAAGQFGCEAVVYLPLGTSGARFEAITALGADASIISGSYDDAVALAAEQAQRNRWLLVQDTAWHGYEDTPLRVMQGYTTLLDEALEQLRGEIPSHVFIQCGVGSLAGAVVAHLHEHLGDERPVFGVVEPVEAACCYQSMAAHTGLPQHLGGEMDTIMTGLACGTPSTVAWSILRDYADVFVSCEDEVTRRGMRLLAKPHGHDPAVTSGESGAVTLGLVACLLGECMRKEHYEAVTVLGLDQSARVLLISTEGATDPISYRRIVANSL